MSARGSEIRVAELESRADPRVASEHCGELTSDQFSGPLAVTTRDLSVGGACIATRSPLALGALRELTLQLPNGSLRLPVSGRWERWSPTMELNLVGLAFRELSHDAQDLLWDSVLEAGKEIARFLLRRSELGEIGIDGSLSLALASRLCLVGPGGTIFQQGGETSGPQSSFYILREGSVVLRTRVRDAIERDIAEVLPGQLFGGLPMISAKSHCESAIARTRCKLLEIDERAFLHLMRSRAWVAQKVAFAAARAYSQRLHATLQRLDARD